MGPRADPLGDAVNMPLDLLSLISRTLDRVQAIYAGQGADESSVYDELKQGLIRAELALDRGDAETGSLDIRAPVKDNTWGIERSLRLIIALEHVVGASLSKSVCSLRVRSTGAKQCCCIRRRQERVGEDLEEFDYLVF